jgi:hypothetical protein
LDSVCSGRPDASTGGHARDAGAADAGAPSEAGDAALKDGSAGAHDGTTEGEGSSGDGGPMNADAADGEADDAMCPSIAPLGDIADAAGVFAFSPSNVTLDTILHYAAMAQDEVISSPISVNTAVPQPFGTDGFSSPVVGLTPMDADSGVTSPLDLVVVKSLTIHSAITVTGSVPLVIVSLSDVVFCGGSLVANSTLNHFGPGGGPGGSSQAAPAVGDGAGPEASSASPAGAGGGSYCGIGGAGGGATATGSTYGSADIRPLMGGSGGGVGGNLGGAGGGAVQIVAAGAILLEADSFVSVSGGGGLRGGSACYQDPGGGGSGGAILVEAPTVTIYGALVANGGGGGGASAGEDGWYGSSSSSPATRAPGGISLSSGETSPPNITDIAEPNSAGGAGGAGTTPNGAPGATGAASCTNSSSDSNSGAGGGGAGRIRINSGMLMKTGAMISPVLIDGGCATTGPLLGSGAGP